MRGPIVVIDPDRLNGDLLRDLLGDQGYIVRQYNGSPENVDSIARLFPDLILIDVHPLAVDHSIPLLRLLAQRPETKDTPILVSSTDVRALGPLHGVNACVRGVIAKPFNFDEFYTLVRRWAGETC